MKKKILALGLSVALLFNTLSLSTVTALAGATQDNGDDLCTHINVTETNGVYTCDDCDEQMAVEVSNYNNSRYYAKSTDEHGADSTLYTALNNAQNGDTVTLLMDDLSAYAVLASNEAESKEITLNTNAKRLLKSNAGISICSGGILNVYEDAYSGAGTGYTFVVKGGTLNLDDWYEGSLGNIRVDGGKLLCNDGPDDRMIEQLEINSSSAEIAIYSCNFDRIYGNAAWKGSVKLGNLIEENAGKAFWSETDKAFLPYDTVISADSCLENVKMIGCNHESLGAENTCNYCGMKYIVALCITPTGALGTCPAPSGNPDDMSSFVNQYVFNTWANLAGTLWLFTDAAIDSKSFIPYYHSTLNLNGHKVTGGTFTLKETPYNVTITDYSESKNGEFTDIVVESTDSLVIDGAAVGKITVNDKKYTVKLKDGSSFSGYKIPDGMLIASWLEDGCFLLDGTVPVNIWENTDTEAEAVDKYIVKKVPADIDVASKTGNLPYGGLIPQSIIPEITLDKNDSLNNGVTSIELEWCYRMRDGSINTITEVPVVIYPDSPEKNNQGKIKNDIFENFDFGDEIKDVYCKITAKNGDTEIWNTLVSGYNLTVTLGELTDVSVKQDKALTYNGRPQQAGVTETATSGNNQTVTFSFCDSKDGIYGDMPEFTDAGEYIVYFKANAPKHEEFSGSFIVTIDRAEPICTAPDAVNATYGQKLNELKLTNPVGNTDGTWSWVDETQSVGNAGENTFKAKFTPADTKNYNSKSNVDVKAIVQPKEVTPVVTLSDSMTYTGKQLRPTVILKDGEAIIPAGQYTVSYGENISAGKAAGSVTIKAGSNYKFAPVTKTFDVKQATVTITVTDKKTYVGDKVLDLSNPQVGKDYTVSGLLGNDKLLTAPELKYVDAEGNEVVPNMNKTGNNVKIAANGADAGKNYGIIYDYGTLTISSRAGSGGYTGSTEKNEEQKNDKEPYVSGAADRSGWDAIKSEIDAKIGESQTTVIVAMNGATVVPGEILDSIKGQNISIVFDMGNDITWTVNGMDITAEKNVDIDFGVIIGAKAGKNIPAELINNVTGESYSLNLTLNYEGDFGLKPVLGFNVDKSNAGLFANLFYYNQTSGELEFIYVKEISKDGLIELSFTHASDYVVVIDEEPMDKISTDRTDITDDTADEITEDIQKTDTPASDSPDKNSDSVTWIVLTLIAILAVLIGAVIIVALVRKKSSDK